jgi:UDP-glucose 4-epimerase
LSVQVDTLGPGSALVTGGAGFIGSHLVDRLVGEGWRVSVIDDLSSGGLAWIKEHMESGRVCFHRCDINDAKGLREAMAGCDTVFHLAADPVIRGGFSSAARRYSPIRNNVLGTYSVLEAMRESSCPSVAFASSSVVYGQADVVPTPESYAPLKPISLYGASKLSGEALITAYAHGFGYRYWIFRFANVIGLRSSQGVVFDFVEKLRKNPRELQILGDGRQRKSYLHVDDCVGAILHSIGVCENEILNLGTPTAIEVNAVARLVEGEMGLDSVKHIYTGGRQGWKGDLPETQLDLGRVMSLGWSPGMDSEAAVRRAARELCVHR